MTAAIAGDVDAGVAECVVRSSSSSRLGSTVRAERKLYYPYFWFHLRHSATTIFGESGLRASCLVDARTRLAATSDEFELERVDPDVRDIVGPEIKEADARRVAERYVGYVMRNRRRALIAPEIEVLDTALVYKPFWIVSCEGEDAPTIRFLVDGVTARFHALPLAPSSSMTRNSSCFERGG